MFLKKIRILATQDVSDLEEILKRDFDNLINNVLKPEKASFLSEQYIKGLLRLFVWMPSELGRDGETGDVYKEGVKYVDIQIEENVLKSGSVCWRMAVLLHELVHAIHLFSPEVSEGKLVKPDEHHGDCWEEIIQKHIKRGNLKICAALETSPEEGCQFQDVCQWCLPHRSVMNIEWPLIPEESPYGGVCLFCDTKAIRPLPHIKKSIECLQKYVTKYGLGYSIVVRLMHAKLKRRNKRTCNSALATVCKFCNAQNFTYLATHVNNSKKCQQKYKFLHEVETLKDLKGILKKKRKCKNQKSYCARRNKN